MSPRAFPRTLGRATRVRQSNDVSLVDDRHVSSRRRQSRENLPQIMGPRPGLMGRLRNQESLRPVSAAAAGARAREEPAQRHGRRTPTKAPKKAGARPRRPLARSAARSLGALRSATRRRASGSHGGSRRPRSPGRCTQRGSSRSTRGLGGGAGPRRRPLHRANVPPRSGHVGPDSGPSSEATCESGALRSTSVSVASV